MSIEIAKHWRLKAQRYKLIGEVCPNCANKIFPPRDVCPYCADQAGPDFQFSGQGTIYSFTTIQTPPQDFEGQAPYTVALIKLPEGPMITAQLTDVDEDKIEIGMPVEMVTRKLTEQGEEGIIVYGYKFRPQLQAA